VRSVVGVFEQSTAELRVGSRRLLCWVSARQNRDLPHTGRWGGRVWVPWRPHRSAQKGSRGRPFFAGAARPSPSRRGRHVRGTHRTRRTHSGWHAQKLHGRWRRAEAADLTDAGHRLMRWTGLDWTGGDYFLLACRLGAACTCTGTGHSTLTPIRVRAGCMCAAAAF
jgi:hypothetical protein